MSLICLPTYFGPGTPDVLTWDPSNKNSAITLSSGNLKATGGSTSWPFVLGTKTINSGKHWFSVTNSGGDYTFVGFFPVGQAVGSYVFSGAQRDNSYSMYSSAFTQSETIKSTGPQKYHGGTNPTIANAIGFGGAGIEVRAELDLDAGTITFYRKLQSTGLWYKQGGGPAFTGVSGAFLPVATCNTAGTSLTANMKCLGNTAADFLVDYPYVSINQPVTFYDQSSGAITSWLWDFGDGTTSTLQNPTHLYGMEGTYTVTLTVISGMGSDTYVATNCVTVSNTITLDPAPGGFGGADVWIANLAPTYTPALSGGNLTLTGNNSTWRSAYATRNAVRTSGVHSFVVTSSGAGTTLMAGIAQLRHNMTLSYAGSDAYGWCNYAANGQSYHSGVATACLSAWNTTKTKIEVDLDAGMLRFYRWNGSSWVVGSSTYTGVNGPVWPCMSVFGSTTVGTVDFAGW